MERLVKERLMRDDRYLNYCFEMVIDELISQDPYTLLPFDKKSKVIFTINRLVYYGLLEIVVNL